MSSKPLATAVAVLALAGYAAWNVYWLSQRKIPPALFKSITGLPAPTTGGTRSAIALFHGDLVASLRFNPMLLPIVGLLGATVVLAVIRRGNAPTWLARAWIIVLAIAWVIKLLSPRETW